METQSQPRRPPDLPRLASVLAFGAFACAAFWAVQLYTLDGVLGFPLDDSWIHLAFARNLSAGHGLALNPGVPVAGSTAPLWTALVALGVRLPGSDLLWAQVLGALLHLGAVLLTWLLARELGLGAGLATVASAFVAATGWLLWSALSGMEIPLFVLFTLAGMVLHLRERRAPARPPLSLAVLGIAALARPEGVLLVVLAAGDRLLLFRRLPDGSLAWEPGPVTSRGWKRLAGGLGLVALAVLPVALYNLSIGGSPLPTTLAAKTEGGPALGLPGLHYLYVAFGILFRALPWMSFLAPAGCVALVRRLGTPRDRGLLPALWLLGLPLAYACLSRPDGPLIGNFGRYLFPLLPMVALLGALGLEPIVLAVGAVGNGRGRLGRRLLALAGLLVLFLPGALAAARVAQLYAQNLADVAAGDVRMARWIADHAPPEAVVATMDVGAMAAILPNPILDLAGIGDPEVHGYIREEKRRGGTWQDGVLAFVAARRPDYLMVFPEWLTAVDRPGSPFRPIHRIDVPGNVTLGRGTLVLYATPWTRYPLRP